ncbi:hypothetical protein [Nocardia violaceofusca]|uniref:hypothetical protein n=1 Tax=Nocardia violaceofusca TaxID=941182 RepID=UPI0007A3EC72|nr:hypothetical protein [Nocardia violaceofusca]
MRLRDAAAATTIAGVQNHFDFGDRQHRSVPGTTASQDRRGIAAGLSIAAWAIASGPMPVPWVRLERPAAVA